MPTASAPAESARYWRHDAVPGVDLLRARYVTHRYARHSHETFTVGVIEAGVEEFAYGSELLRAGPGTVALLDPEVVHTGQAGVPEGWAYRVLYPSVDLVAGIAAELGAAPGTPSFPRTVVDDPVAARLDRDGRAQLNGHRQHEAARVVGVVADEVDAPAGAGTNCRVLAENLLKAAAGRHSRIFLSAAAAASGVTSLAKTPAPNSVPARNLSLSGARRMGRISI